MDGTDTLDIQVGWGSWHQTWGISSDSDGLAPAQDYGEQGLDNNTYTYHMKLLARFNPRIYGSLVSWSEP